MTNEDMMRMLVTCREEIASLRRRIEHLEPRAEAYETIARMMGLMVKPKEGGYGPDVLWLINRRIEEMEKEKAAAQSKEHAEAGDQFGFPSGDDGDVLFAYEGDGRCTTIKKVLRHPTGGLAPEPFLRLSLDGAITLPNGQIVWPAHKARYRHAGEDPTGDPSAAPPEGEPPAGGEAG